MATKRKAVTRAENLKRAMLADLRARDMENPIFLERIDDYMMFYEQLHNLSQDLKDNGTMEYDKFGSLVPRKSVSESVRVSRELGKIWQELGFIEIVKAKGTPDGDDPL